jgi:hypothetical protein
MKKTTYTVGQAILDKKGAIDTWTLDNHPEFDTLEQAQAHAAKEKVNHNLTERECWLRAMEIVKNTYDDNGAVVETETIDVIYYNEKE